MADLDALNDEDVCRGSSLGDLVVRLMPGGYLGVCTLDPYEPELRGSKCFHALVPRFVDDKPSTLTAFYGRGFFEGRLVVEGIMKEKAARQASAAGVRADQSRDLNKALLKILQGTHGEDARLLLLGRG